MVEVLGEVKGVVEGRGGFELLGVFWLRQLERETKNNKEINSIFFFIGF